MFNKKPFITLSFILLLFLSSFQKQEKTIQGDITPQQVQESFNSTGLKGKHSRLFFNDADLQRVQNLYQQKDPLISIGYEDINRKANEILRSPVLTYSLDAAKLRIPSIHTFAVQLPNLVMMYQFTGDKIYAERAWAQLAQFIDYPDWGANRHFLDSGIAGFNFALAYDGLFDYLSEDQKTRLKGAVMKHLLIPAKLQMEKRVWWHTATHNWNGICNGGIIMAALAMFEDDPELMSQIIALAANALPYYINSFEPDGQSDEGVKYWSYGLMYTTIALESMYRVLGTTYQIDQAPGFKKTGWFPLYVSGPVSSLSIGDDPIKSSRSTSFFWFAKRNQDKALAKMQYDLCLENNTMTWADMIYYNPEMVKGISTISSMPKDNYIRGIELMSLRENWDRDGLFIAMHGGDNDANHGHLDAGTFDIQGLGEVWAYGDLGSDDYTYPGYFTKVTHPDYNKEPYPQTEAGRWHFYRLRAEGKNCLIINPDTRPDQDPKAEAHMIRQRSNTNQGSFVLDLTDCYKRDVTTYHRGIKLDRINKIMTVQDEVSAKKPSDMWWSMHTKANIKIAKDGRSAILSIGKKKMTVMITSPSNVKFKVLPATYLPGQSFPLTKNSLNKGFKKLAIELKDTKDQTIKVDFFPTNADKRFKERNTALSEW